MEMSSQTTFCSNGWCGRWERRTRLELRCCETMERLFVAFPVIRQVRPVVLVETREGMYE